MVLSHSVLIAIPKFQGEKVNHLLDPTSGEVFNYTLQIMPNNSVMLKFVVSLLQLLTQKEGIAKGSANATS